MKSSTARPVVRAVALSVALVLAGCADAPLAHFPGPPTESLTVIGRGWHTEIGLPIAALGPRLATIAAHFPGARVLTFGFGDRAFVLERGDRFSEAIGALLPSPGLVLVTALNTSPEAAFGRGYVVRLHLTPQGLEHIEAFIWDSLESGHGEPTPYGPGPYPGTLYYASTMTYDAFTTCNTWIAEALRAGGVPVPANGVLFAAQVMGDARGIARASPGG